MRVMTLHGSKGLSAEVVFLVGLEEEAIPGPHRSKYAGQVQEAARMLYVGMTRARYCCVMSYANKRFHNGAHVARSQSRYLSHTGGKFEMRDKPMATAEVDEVVEARSAMQVARGKGSN